MRTKSLLRLVTLLSLPLGACTQSDPRMVQLLLPEGEVAAGRQAFVELRCTACHTVSGEDALPAPEVPETAFELGPSLVGLSGGGIATSVIAPSHVNAEATELWTDWEEGQRVWLGPSQVVTEAEEPRQRRRSRMSNYASVMTIRQLSDLVTFLGSAAEAD